MVPNRVLKYNKESMFVLIHFLIHKRKRICVKKTREKKRSSKRQSKGCFFVILMIFISIFSFRFLYNQIIHPTMSAKYVSDVNTVEPIELPKHSYHWERLTSENGRKQYIYDNGVQAFQGIDVSKHQDEIDWQQIKQDGINFAILRVGYRGYGNGEIVKDVNFDYNIQEATRAGIDTGVYFFSQAISEEEASEEAEFVLNSIENYKVTYPVIFDMEEIHMEEDRIQHLSTEERTKITLAFCKEIEKVGYTPMIYGSDFWLQNKINLPEVFQYDLWVAKYADEPSFPYEFQMWQYTNEGDVNGISGNVDLNICFKDYSKNEK